MLGMNGIAATKDQILSPKTHSVISGLITETHRKAAKYGIITWWLVYSSLGGYPESVKRFGKKPIINVPSV